MDSVVNVTVHSSQFPSQQIADLHSALATNELPAKLLYEGPRQTQKWIALHKAFSPAQTDPRCAAIYDNSFKAAVENINGPVAHVVAVSVGDATKDIRLVEAVRNKGKIALFTPCDSSVSLVLTAHQNATSAIRGLQSNPLVFDVLQCAELPALLKSIDPAGSERLITFFGAIHNFEPSRAFKQLLKAVRSQDLLLVSANLASQSSYQSGLLDVLPGYNNQLTRDWILSALSDLGLNSSAGELQFTIGHSPSIPGLKCVEAIFVFGARAEVTVHDKTFSFVPGDKLLTFYSYRYTLEIIREVLQANNLSIAEEFSIESEAVFLCRRKN